MSKGEATRERILDRAFRLAAQQGLDGLSIGGLATDLGLSKSGLFAHFGSKEELQLEVLRAATVRFTDRVIQPALQAERGEPRLRVLFERWLRWYHDPKNPGGCIFLAAAVELDDQEGRPRSYLVETQQQMLTFIQGSVARAVEAGHFRRNVDAEQFAFELYGILQGCHFMSRLLRDSKAEQKARASFERLLESARKPR